MTVLAILLVGIGLTDVLRGRADIGQRSLPQRWPALGAGLTIMVILGLTSLSGSADDFVLLAFAGLVVVAWVVLEDYARQRQQLHALPVAVLLGGVAVLIAFSGWPSGGGGPLDRWLEQMDFAPIAQLSAERFLLLTGLVLLQLSTGNRLVRLVLTSIGALRVPSSPQPSDRLRGGRLLGPMERIFILGLGLAGQLTAAGIVIAAKGIIRWPELQATPADQRVGVDEVTEYFLIGSFTSWLLALGSLWLAS